MKAKKKTKKAKEEVEEEEENSVFVSRYEDDWVRPALYPPPPFPQPSSCSSIEAV